MKEQSEILERHKKMLEREYMQTSYLDQFPLEEYDLPSVTVVIPTFNRSPHPIKEDSNPLGWCLESLLAQRAGGLDQIVVVDDASKDHTENVVRSFSNNSPIPIVYLRNKEKRGLSASRNRGLDKSRNDSVMFVDDDCVFSRYMLFGANYTLSLLDDNVSALQLPTYHRRTVPFPVKISEIGVLDMDEGVITGNFDGFPIEYTENLEGSFIDEGLKILRPIEIKNLAGIFLASKDVLTEVGRFPESFKWKNEFGIETDLALRLFENGYRMFFSPDPKLHCVHLKYGAEDVKRVSEDLGPRLNQLVEKSDVSREGTGCRVSTEEWFYDLILSTYVVLGRRSPDAARAYAERMQSRFVEENSFVVGGVGTKIENRDERQDIFYRAVKEGERSINRTLAVR